MNKRLTDPMPLTWGTFLLILITGILFGSSIERCINMQHNQCPPPHSENV